MVFNISYKVGRRSFKTTVSGASCDNNEFLARMIAQAHFYDFGVNITRKEVKKVEVSHASDVEQETEMLMNNAVLHNCW